MSNLNITLLWKRKILGLTPVYLKLEITIFSIKRLLMLETFIPHSNTLDAKCIHRQELWGNVYERYVDPQWLESWAFLFPRGSPSDNDLVCVWKCVQVLMIFICFRLNSSKVSNSILSCKNFNNPERFGKLFIRDLKLMTISRFMTTW